MPPEETTSTLAPGMAFKMACSSAPAVEGVEVVQVLTFGSSAYASPEMAGHLRVNTVFVSDNRIFASLNKLT